MARPFSEGNKVMIILGIETSCDETSASIVENGTKLLSLTTATSEAMHAKYGGILPDKAAREQLKSILPTISEALASSNQQPETISAIAVTTGPGLIGSLLIGVETAKSLAFTWNKPLICVNHLIGHIYANWLDTEKVPEFPALVLLVSGGHTELILMKNHGDFKLIGSTKDDAAGECFDKCGRLLGLPHPFGIYVQDEADKYNSNGHQPFLPRPMISQQNFDFSFSGLKTAVLNSVQKQSPPNIPQLAFELQEAITDCLVEKTKLAAKIFNPRSILLAGGVAANKRLREKMQQTFKNSNLHTPPLKLCTDNAAVIASAAHFNQNQTPPEEINADPSLSISKA